MSSRVMNDEARVALRVRWRTNRLTSLTVFKTAIRPSSSSTAAAGFFSFLRKSLSTLAAGGLRRMVTYTGMSTPLSRKRRRLIRVSFSPVLAVTVCASCSLSTTTEVQQKSSGRWVLNR